MATQALSRSFRVFPMLRVLWSLLAILSLYGCAQLPSSGPTREALQASSAASAPEGGSVQLVDVDDRIARTLAATGRRNRFSDDLPSAARPETAGRLGPGDAVEVTIWEAPPATLFGAGIADARGGPSAARPATLPEQVIDREGLITVPFAGRVPAAGQTLQNLAEEIARRLRGKANQPEVVVRLARNGSSTVTVVGEVSQSLRMPLTPSGERVLDALAQAGGVKQAVNKMTLQLTRGPRTVAMPLDVVIRDPLQNVALQPGDILTALFQPLSFTALGATGKNEEVPFEAQGISLAQALARVGGLQDNRSDPRGVFLFRLERSDALDWPRQPAATTPDGRVPVVYRIDLTNPASFFVIQGFEVRDKDVLYVSNASAAELQKFLNLVFSIVYPVLNVYQISR